MPLAPKPTIDTKPVIGGGKKFFVQAGAFSKQSSAQNLSGKLRRIGSVNMTVANINGTDFYRVRLGPYNTEDEAYTTLDKLKNYGIADARVVKD